MTNKVLSIEIGIETTKVCELDYKKKNPKIYQCLTFDTPQNIIEDGYIRDKNQLAEVMKNKLREANIKNNKVIFTVASTKISNREITIPMMNDDKIKDMLKVNGNDYFPVDITEYIVTYSILERNKEENKMRLLVYAAPNNLIKNYYSFADLMNFDILAIDYFGNSSYQLIRKQVDTLTNLVIHMNEQSTLISILENNVLMLQRTIAYGTEEIVNIMLNYNLFGVTNEKQALELLRRRELIQSEKDNSKSEDPNTNLGLEEVAIASELGKSENSSSYPYSQVQEEITESLKYLVSNVTRVIDYYRSKNKDKRMNAIYITGTGARLNGIERLFQQETDLEIKKIDKLACVNFDKGVEVAFLDETDYISCIGATLQPIDFLPKEKARKNLQKSNLQLPVMLLIFSTVSSLLIVGTSYLSLNQVKNEKKQLEKEIDAQPDIDSIIELHTLTTSKYKSLTEMKSLTKSPNTQLYNIINDMETYLPSSMVVQSINFTKTGFTMNITTDTKESVAKLILQIKQLKYLKSYGLASIIEAKNEYGVKTVSFSITCTYNRLLELLEDIKE